MTEHYTEEYIASFKRKAHRYGIIAHLMKTRLINKIDLSSYRGFILEGTIDQIWGFGKLKPDTKFVYIIKEDDEYVIYSFRRDPPSVIKMFITIESFDHVFEELARIQTYEKKQLQKQQDVWDESFSKEKTKTKRRLFK